MEVAKKKVGSCAKRQIFNWEHETDLVVRHAVHLPAREQKARPERDTETSETNNSPFASVFNPDKGKCVESESRTHTDSLAAVKLHTYVVVIYLCRSTYVRESTRDRSIVTAVNAAPE